MTEASAGSRPKLLIALLSGTLVASACASSSIAPSQAASTSIEEESQSKCAPNPSLTNASQRVQSLVSQMTLDEKLGQLNQAAGGRSKSLNSKLTSDELEKVRRGEIGSYLHVAGAEPLGELQKVAVEESRLGIPLLFAMDVVHGYRTVFPVPLAMAASWDPELWEEAARISADEASASGLHWTFAPMVDISRDPRWGRIVEGAGADPYLGSRMAVAQVQGYQGEDLSDSTTILAATKHFGAYGAPTGGRDYGSADISEQSLMEVYLPPFYAATKAGTGSMMTAFNDIAGVPSTANEYLIDDVLRAEWGFDGMIVSDWNAVAELINHGVAETEEQAGTLALQAGVDMDMTSMVLPTKIKAAVQSDACLAHDLDAAVARILTTKERLGLFDTPMAYHNPEREKTTLLKDEFRRAARHAAVKSMVLLKNEKQTLPLSSSPQTIAVIGGLAEDKLTQLGSWRAQGKTDDVVSLLEGLQRNAPSGTTVTYAAGTHPSSESPGAIQQAVDTAMDADQVLLVIGEDFDLSGEARSRSDIALPPSQSELAQAIFATGKPVTVILVTGRPLAIEDEVAAADAVLNTWMLGVEAGNALADVVWGSTSPAGRLPIEFPRRTGAVPHTYSEYPGGRPADPDLSKDTNRFMDIPITPLFPFGHGLSYSSFDYSDLQSSVFEDGQIELSTTITNIGDVDADEVVQLYMRDPLATIARPKRELRGFTRVSIPAGENRQVSFTISPDQTALYRVGSGWVVEPGQIDFMIGASAEDIRSKTSVTLTHDRSTGIPASAIETGIRIK
ncbi:glycoside hydrolase family 3 N-terminal domain-containing protein [Hyphomonas atlantica corrig.]|uniref:glycoside hydrolase family 3 N-terminal domain-containing protein n=1 Tax=Hyphomonas atlantica TaxID=1280948 RepID=UPI002356487C|nr:glycoside hydrolase family 3 N-terminal domain-containing protein [Hyphomonas atlantica]